MNNYKFYCIGHFLLGRRVSTKSFYRYGDKNMLEGSHKIIYANYLKNNGSHLDVLAMQASEEFFIEIEPNDIIEFMYQYLKNPFTRKIKPQLYDSSH